MPSCEFRSSLQGVSARIRPLDSMMSPSSTLGLKFCDFVGAIRFVLRRLDLPIESLYVSDRRDMVPALSFAAPSEEHVVSI